MVKKVIILLLVTLNLFAIQIGNPAPTFRLPVYNKNTTVSLEELIDNKNVVILSFFSKTCKACKKEITILNQLYPEYEKKGIKIRLIAVDSNGEKDVKEFKSEFKTDIPILVDKEGIIAGERYGVIKYRKAELPKSYVVDKNGIFRKIFEYYDPEMKEELNLIVLKLLSEKVTEKQNLLICYTSGFNGKLDYFYDTVLKTFSDIRDKNKILLIDSGDFMDPTARDKKWYMNQLKKMRKLSYDFICPGDQEFLMGQKLINNVIKLKFPLYVSNVAQCDDEKCASITDDYLIIEKKGIKIGIIGILPETSFSMFFPADKKSYLKFIEPNKVVPLLTKDLAEKTDFIIMVYHGDHIAAEELLRAIPDNKIDLVLCGHTLSELNNYRKVGQTIITKVVSSKTKFCLLDYIIDKNNNLKLNKYSTLKFK